MCSDYKHDKREYIRIKEYKRYADDEAFNFTCFSCQNAETKSLPS